MQSRVSHQSTRKQSTLAQDLKTVADPEDELPFRGEILHRVHHRRKSRQRTGPKIIAVGKSSGNDHRIVTAKIGFFVPDEIDRLTDVLRHNVIGVVITIGTGKYYYSELHKLVS